MPSIIKSKSFLPLLAVLAVSLCWGIGGPVSWVILQSLSVPETTFGRCFFAFISLLPFFFLDSKKILMNLRGRAKLLLVFSGLMLGVHFYLFIAGVAYASLSTAVTLVAVEPVLILLVGILGFKERLLFESLIGILLCIVGIVVISVLPHYWMSHENIAIGKSYGDACAVLAVITYGTYYALNRAFRRYENSLPHDLSPLRRSFGLASIIYFFAVISSGILALASHSSWKISLNSMGGSMGKTLMALAVIGLIPTTLGHTLNQIASRTLHPVWVSLMSPGETVMALFLGYVFLGQNIDGFQATGGILILMGTAVVVRSEAKLTTNLKG